MYPPHHLGGYELVWQSAVDDLRVARPRRPRPLQRSPRGLGGRPSRRARRPPGPALVLARPCLPTARPAGPARARAPQRGDLRRTSRRLPAGRRLLVGDGRDVAVPDRAGPPPRPPGRRLRQRRLADLWTPGRRVDPLRDPTWCVPRPARAGHRPAGALRPAGERSFRLRERGHPPGVARAVADRGQRGRPRGHPPQLPRPVLAAGRVGLAAAVRRADRSPQGHRHGDPRARSAPGRRPAAGRRWGRRDMPRGAPRARRRSRAGRPRELRRAAPARRAAGRLRGRRCRRLPGRVGRAVGARAAGGDGPRPSGRRDRDRRIGRVSPRRGELPALHAGRPGCPGRAADPAGRRRRAAVEAPRAAAWRPPGRTPTRRSTPGWKPCWPRRWRGVEGRGTQPDAVVRPPPGRRSRMLGRGLPTTCATGRRSCGRRSG